MDPALAQQIGDLFPANPPTREEIIAGAKIPGPAMTRGDLREAMKIARERGMRTKDVPHGVMIAVNGYWIPRKNEFLGRWIKHGGYWPDPKVRLFRKGKAQFEDRAVHEDAHLTEGMAQHLHGAILHHSYPTLADYIDHMNRYSSLGAEMAAAKGQGGFNLFNIVVRPWATFVYNYFFRLGFLDGREGLLLHLYHAVYVSWKYAKAWELARKKDSE